MNRKENSAKLFVNRERWRGSLAESFRHAFRGFAWVFRTERNFRIHVGASVLLGASGWFFRLDPPEWAIVILAAALVLVAETMNTAIEYLADAVHPQPHPLVGRAKDAASASVLIAAVAATVLGAIVLLPKLWQLWETGQRPGG